MSISKNKTGYYWLLDTTIDYVIDIKWYFSATLNSRKLNFIVIWFLYIFRSNSWLATYSGLKFFLRNFSQRSSLN